MCVSGAVCWSTWMIPPSSPLNECWAERVPGIRPFLESRVVLCVSFIMTPYDAVLPDAADPSHTDTSWFVVILCTFGCCPLQDLHFLFCVPQLEWFGVWHDMHLFSANL